MLGWINNSLAVPGLNLIMLPALLLFGALNAVGMGCNLPFFAMLSGYVCAGKNRPRADILSVTISFMLGTMVTLLVLGLAVGYAGQVTGGSIERYSMLLAGFISIFFGLMTLNLLPRGLMQRFAMKRENKKYPEGVPAAVLFGLTSGITSITCALACGTPGLPIILGIASLQGHAGRSAVLLGFYAAGYAAPFCAVLLGAGLGTWALRASRIMPAVRIVGGVLLFVIGFYLLASA